MTSARDDAAGAAPAAHSYMAPGCPPVSPWPASSSMHGKLAAELDIISLWKEYHGQTRHVAHAIPSSQGPTPVGDAVTNHGAVECSRERCAPPSRLHQSAAVGTWLSTRVSIDQPRLASPAAPDTAFVSVYSASNLAPAFHYHHHHGRHHDHPPFHPPTPVHNTTSKLTSPLFHCYWRRTSLRTCIRPAKLSEADNVAPGDWGGESVCPNRKLRRRSASCSEVSPIPCFLTR